jgi:hypothetical protein
MHEARGQYIVKLVSFAEHLSSFPVRSTRIIHPEASLTRSQGSAKGKDDTTYWERFTRNFFSEQGVFRYCPSVQQDNEQPEKTYEITYPALARYFHTQFDSGVKRMQFIMEQQTTDRPLQEGHLVENPRASFVYWFDNGSRVSSIAI